MNVKDPTGHLARWALHLQQYDFEIIHRPGRLNGNADALSRRLYDAPLSSVEKGGRLSVPVAVRVPPSPPAQALNFLQCQDKDLAMIITYFETLQLPSSDTQARNLMLTIDSYYLDERGLLCHWWTLGKRHVHSLVSQLVIPASLRHDVLVACHELPICWPL